MVEDITKEILLELEDTKEGFFAKLWRQLKSGLLGTLYVMANDTTMSFKVNLIGMFIDFCQMLAFPLSTSSEWPWNQAFAWFTMEFMYYAKLEFYISESDAIWNLIIYWLMFASVFLNLINFLYVGYNFIKQRAQNVFLLKTLRIVTNLFTTVLYQPILQQFCIIFACGLDPMVLDGGCPTDNQELLAVTSMGITVVFTLVSLIAAASFFDQDPASDDATARPHARIELVALVSKAWITFQSSMWDGPEFHLSLIFTIMLIGITVTYLYIFYLPYYHYETTVIQAQFYAIYLWCGFCLCIALLENNPGDAGPITLFYVGSFCIWKLTRAACDWRRTAIRFKMDHQIKNQYEAELKVRYTIIEESGTLKPSGREDEEFYEEIEHFYFDMEKKFPSDSFLQLFIAQFYLTYKQSSDDAMVKINKAEAFKPALDEEFIIYRRRQLANATSSDTIQSVTFASHLQAAHLAQTNATAAQVAFWKALKSANWEKLLRLSKTISKNIGNAQHHFELLHNMKATHSKLLKMYAFFQADCLNETVQAQDFLNKAAKLETKVVESVDRRDIDTGIYEISLESNTLGEVIKTNEDGQKLLMAPKSAIINNLFARFMPFPFNAMFMDHLRETKEQLHEYAELNMDKSIDSYVIDSLGYLNRINYFITWSSVNYSRKQSGLLYPRLSRFTTGLDGYSRLGDTTEHEGTSVISDMESASVFSDGHSEYGNQQQSIEINETQIKESFMKYSDQQVQAQPSPVHTSSDIAAGEQSNISLGMLASALVSATGQEKREPRTPDFSEVPMTATIRRINLSTFLYKEAGMKSVTPTLLLNSQYVIQNFNREAEALIGISIEQCGVVKLNKYIFRFEESLHKCIMDMQEKGESYAPEFSTYICTSLGKIMRIKLGFEEISYNNESTTIVFLEPLPDFSKVAEDFLKLMASFMITRVKDLPNMQLFEQYAAASHSAIGTGERNKEQLAEQVHHDMKKHISEYNKNFSPELASLRFVLKIVLLIEVLLFVGSYIAQRLIFIDYVNDIDRLQKVTFIQNDSILLSSYMILLDFKRQGALVSEEYDSLVSTMASIRDDMGSNLDDLTDQAEIQGLDDETLDLATISANTGDFDTEQHNIATSISKQIQITQKLEEQPFQTAFDIIENRDTFWVFQNGRVSIAQGLEQAVISYMDTADETRLSLLTFTVAFCVIEFGILLFLAVVSVPLIRRSEKIFRSVLKIFNEIEPYIIKYLCNASKRNLELLKAENYPDNKGKIDSEGTILRHIFTYKQKFKFKGKRFDTLEFQAANKDTKISIGNCAILKNRIMKRLYLFFAFCLVYIAVLQTWLCQFDAAESVSQAATLIKHTATFNSIFHRSMVNFQAAIYFDPDPDPPTYEDMLTATAKTRNETDHIHSYQKFFQLGDSDIIGHAYMYGLATDTFDHLLLNDQCWTSECPQFYHELAESGALFDASELYCMDIDWLLAENLDAQDKNRVDRFNNREKEVNRIIDYDLIHTNSLLLKLQEEIKDHFETIVEEYTNI